MWSCRYIYIRGGRRSPVDPAAVAAAAVAAAGTFASVVKSLSFVYFKHSFIVTSSTMASSQRDMFLSSPEKSPNPRIASSLPASGTYVYLWCILFDWDPNVEHPFDLYQVALFSSHELKSIWLSGDLDVESRKKKLTFSCFPGKTFSLFAKVEKCTYIN